MVIMCSGNLVHKAQKSPQKKKKIYVYTHTNNMKFAIVKGIFLKEYKAVIIIMYQT